MEHNYFEFAVTKNCDWTETETVFVKAVSSHDAIKYMLKITCPTKIRPFVDFKFRTALPECCLPFNAFIFFPSQA